MARVAANGAAGPGGAENPDTAAFTACGRSRTLTLTRHQNRSLCRRFEDTEEGTVCPQIPESISCAIPLLGAP